MNLFLPVFLGGGIGAVLRYGIGVFVIKHLKTHLPLSTFFANMLAILIMGITIYMAQSKMESDPWVRAFVIVGICGGLSTFSTFSLETIMLMKLGHWFYALANVVVSVAVGLVLIAPFVKLGNS
jgi:CrcB protein